ncbi:MAG TPA: MBOAT family O-acyltransferase [Acetobacteraceae bacterium]
MLFNSYVFIAAFLPLTLGGFALAGRFGPFAAVLWLVTASLFFYGWWNPPFVVLLLGSMAGNYAASRLILRLAPRPQRQRSVLAVAIAANLSALFWCKYLAALLGFLRLHGIADVPIADPILPLGISFFTFTQLGYLIDCQQGQAQERSLPHYALFVTFFPHLIAGPILHHREMMPQFADPSVWRLRADSIAVGSAIFVIGLLKKTLLADPLAPIASAGYAHPEALTCFPAWHAALAYSLQLYFDFSGYSDMAIGLARMFNIRFPINFNSPYRAESVIDYWQRWHMTLTRWLTLYLYNPLALSIVRRRAARGLPIDRAARATSRGFAAMVAWPTMVTIGLAGVWHGSGLTFLVFGLLHGVYLCINHAWRLWRPGARSAARGAVVARVALTYGCVLLGSVFFRAPSVGAAGSMLSGMLGWHGVDVVPPAPRDVLDLLWLIALYAIVWGAPNTQQIMRDHAPALGRIAAGPLPRLAWQPSLPWAVACGGAAALALLSIGGTGEFLYYRF